MHARRAAVKVTWRRVAEDGSAWVADPSLHLAAWETEHGWAWHILDRQGLVKVQGCGKPDLATAKAAAERHAFGEVLTRRKAGAVL